MKKLVWLATILLGLTACGGSTVGAPSTTATTVVESTAISLSGVGFEVHQEPG